MTHLARRNFFPALVVTVVTLLGLVSWIIWADPGYKWVWYEIESKIEIPINIIFGLVLLFGGVFLTSTLLLSSKTRGVWVTIVAVGLFLCWTSGSWLTSRFYIFIAFCCLPIVVLVVIKASKLSLWQKLRTRRFKKIRRVG